MSASLWRTQTIGLRAESAYGGGIQSIEADHCSLCLSLSLSLSLSLLLVTSVTPPPGRKPIFPIPLATDPGRAFCAASLHTYSPCAVCIAPKKFSGRSVSYVFEVQPGLTWRMKMHSCPAHVRLWSALPRFATFLHLCFFMARGRGQAAPPPSPHLPFVRPAKYIHLGDSTVAPVFVSRPLFEAGPSAWVFHKPSSAECRPMPQREAGRGARLVRLDHGGTDGRHPQAAACRHAARSDGAACDRNAHAIGGAGREVVHVLEGRAGGGGRLESEGAVGDHATFAVPARF